MKMYLFIGAYVAAVCGFATYTQEPVVVKDEISPRYETAAIEEVEPDWAKYSQEELDLVCSLVMAEARGESREGQMAVAQTIRDRSNFWGYSIEDTIYRDGAFADLYQGEISDSVKGAVSEVFLDGVSVYPDGVTHFHRSDSTPYWAEDKIFLGQIGNHKFYT